MKNLFPRESRREHYMCWQQVRSASRFPRQGSHRLAPVRFVVRWHFWKIASPAQQRRLKEKSDRKSTRLNSSHVSISYAVFCLKKKMLNSEYCIPPLDLAYSALLLDLEQRRLLDEILVVVMGKFGRTPNSNDMMVRDHSWSRFM